MTGILVDIPGEENRPIPGKKRRMPGPAVRIKFRQYNWENSNDPHHGYLITMKFTAICQSNRQVLWLLEHPEYSGNISRWIAANPSACWELKQHNIPFSSLAETQVNKSRGDIESLQQDQVRWAQKVDEVLQGKIPGCESGDFSPAKNYLYYLKNTWDTILNRADLLESVTKSTSLDNLIYFTNPHPVHYGDDLTMDGSVLSECIPPWADHHGIRLTPLQAPSGDLVWQPQVHTRPGIRQRITSFIPASVRTEIESIHHDPGEYLSGIHPVFLGSGPKNRKGTIIVRASYDMTPEISGLLRGKGYRLLPFKLAVSRSCRYARSPRLCDQVFAEVWKDLTNTDWFFYPGGWQKWSLRPVLEPLFSSFWSMILPRIWTGFTGSQTYLQHQRPRALCVPSIWGPEETGFVMAAHNENVPVIFYQHGACMGDIENSIWDLTDSWYGDFQLVYGEGSARYLGSRKTASPPRPVPVGSARLDLVSQGISDKKRSLIRESIPGGADVPLVVYVPGVVFNNFFRYTHQNLRDCNNFETRSRMAEVFHDHPELRFVYKTFISQGHNPTLEMLDATCPECSIIDSIPLTELQWAADLLIHEIPCTAMFEGLVTDKPMIVFVDSAIYTMNPHAKEILKKRSMVAETGNDFVEQVRQFLEDGDFSPIRAPDREFIREFCTHLDDGRSAQRAADEIVDIARKGTDSIGS